MLDWLQERTKTELMAISWTFFAFSVVLGQKFFLSFLSDAQPSLATAAFGTTCLIYTAVALIVGAKIWQKPAAKKIHEAAGKSLQDRGRIYRSKGFRGDLSP